VDEDTVLFARLRIRLAKSHIEESCLAATAIQRSFRRRQRNLQLIASRQGHAEFFLGPAASGHGWPGGAGQQPGGAAAAAAGMGGRPPHPERTVSTERALEQRAASRLTRQLADAQQEREHLREILGVLEIVRCMHAYSWRARTWAAVPAVPAAARD
jgi:hypothetical protein